MPPFLCPEGMGGGAGSPAAQRGQKKRYAVWRDNPPPCQTRFLRATSYEEARLSETKGRKSELIL